MPVFSQIHKWPDMKDSQVIALSCESLQQDVKSCKSHLNSNSKCRTGLLKELIKFANLFRNSRLN